ncbi:MAG: hypothetical protein AAGC81_16670 [Pseudomonadota bacterium]
MGWPFEEATMSAMEGAYYSAVGAETLWVGLSIVCCLAALIVGARHELDAYRKAEN